jgi:hypothetical protein
MMRRPWRFSAANSGLQVIAHQVEFMPIVLLGGMEGRLRLRRQQGENQPTFTGVHGRKSQDVAKEGAVGLRVLAVDDNMRAVDGKDLLLSLIIDAGEPVTFGHLEVAPQSASQRRESPGLSKISNPHSV